MTVTEVRGFGRQRGHTERYRGSEYKVDFLPKLQVVVLLRAVEADAVRKMLEVVCQDHEIGAGILYLKEVRDAVRLRTGEKLLGQNPHP